MFSGSGSGGQRLEVELNRFNPRKIAPAVEALLAGGVIIAPTDSVYSFICVADQKSAVDRLRLIKDVTNRHPLSLHCADISQASQFAVVDQVAHRLLKRYCPGPYTIVLPAKRNISKTLRQKRDEVGIRISDHILVSHLLQSVNSPLISTSVTLTGADDDANPSDADDYVESPIVDVDLIAERYAAQVAVLIDAGPIPNQLTTVLKLTAGDITCLRSGLGPYP